MSAFWKDHKLEATGPAIMKSLNTICICNKDIHRSSHDSINEDSETGIHMKCQCNQSRSFLLIDGQEYLRVSNAEQFMEKLNCSDKDLEVKVVSIFGNTGDGKSHTLNQTFFKGKEIFETSNDQNSCTLGVWAALDPNLNVICLDTEGLLGTITFTFMKYTIETCDIYNKFYYVCLGITSHENERMRLLLKVLAVSDVVVYRTQSEKLNRDLFTFLGIASRAYSHHFQTALQEIGQRKGVLGSLSALGPSIIVLHETRYTRPLTNSTYCHIFSFTVISKQEFIYNLKHLFYNEYIMFFLW